ncbi:MAG: phosphatase PAP2 family protein, partial [Gaiellaceae bacterium]
RQGAVDLVAAVPSLHLGGTMLFCIFMWRRVRKWLRPLLVAYPIAMTFSLVYTGEHYLSDCVAGALAAALVSFVADRIERRRERARAVDTLADEDQPAPSMESLCPPTTEPPTAMTPSST